MNNDKRSTLFERINEMVAGIESQNRAILDYAWEVDEKKLEQLLEKIKSDQKKNLDNGGEYRCLVKLLDYAYITQQRYGYKAYAYKLIAIRNRYSDGILPIDKDSPEGYQIEQEDAC